MTQRRSKAQRRRRRRIKIIIRLAVMVIAIAAVVVGAVFLIKAFKGSTPVKEEQVIYAPGPPSPAIASTASIASTGDILLHDSVLNGARTEDGFDFTDSFSKVAGYWGNYDLMLANLEVPCGGEESGDYRGYPSFNAPDEIINALSNAGVDMFLTANNHAYDTGGYGLTRTQEVINDYFSEDAPGDHYVGSRQSEDENYVKIKDVNGIKFGIACYTFDTRNDPGDSKSINGIPMDSEYQGLINSFCYNDLDTLYASIDSDLSYMKSQDCDVTVFFMHWGDEYTDEPNWAEEEISNQMCNMGVDVIIGGHPHVIQKFSVLNAENGNQTLCLYSMGNTISSQRKAIMNEDDYRGYTEDGLTISFKYIKFNNGKIKLQEVYILPTWVEVMDDGTYTIVPLEQNLIVDKWQTRSRSEAIASYNRTLGRIGEDYLILRYYLGNDELKTYIED